MLEGIKKVKENKILKTIWNIIYTLLFLIVVLMLIVVVMQRVTDNSITIGGIRMFSVATGSMKPVYEVGDVLISKEIEPEEIKVGDDIVYRGKKSSFSGKIISNYKVPYSFRVEEIDNSKFDKLHEVTHILKKKTGSKQYSELTFGDKNTIKDLSEEIQNLIQLL